MSRNMVVHHVRKLTNFLLMFVQETAATWQQLRLLRRLTVSLIFLVVEHVLTQGKHCISHSVITAPIYIIGKRQVWG
jgi:hypothetical protein